ncbi:MAG TPA: hypothetical protein V6C63_14235 [Allocoleopsis sp.]
MNMNAQPEEDRHLLRWIKASTDPSNVRILGNTEREVLIYCGEDVELADALWRSRKLLGENPTKHPTIWVEGRRYTPAPPEPQLEVKASICGTYPMINNLEAMNSVWIKQNAALFGSIEGTCYIFSTEPGYRHLAVRPDLSPGRLNRSVDLLLKDGGQPLSIVDPVIATPRSRAIAEAIETGEAAICYHEHFWMNAVWYFESTAVKVTESEVLVIVRDNPKEPKATWQREYWKRVAEAASGS